MIDIGNRARAVIARLQAIRDRYDQYMVDKNRAEAALMNHLRALNQPERPVKWFPDAVSAFVYVSGLIGAARDADWSTA